MSKKSQEPLFWLLLILATSFLLRFAHWLAVGQQPFFAQLIMDSWEYDRWALEIAGGNWIGSEVFFQAPLYPYLLAVIYAVFGHHLTLVYLLQIVAAVAGSYALYRAAKLMVGRIPGLLAAGLAAIYGVFIFYDVQVLKESLAVTLVSFLLWALASARATGKDRTWFRAGLLCGLIALLRENMLLVVPFLFLLTFGRDGRRLAWLRRSGALLAGTIVILLPVAVRNGIVGGVFLPTTFQAGTNFYIGNNPSANGTYQPIVPGKQMPEFERKEPIRIAEMETGHKLTPSQVSRFWMRKGLDWAGHHPADFLKLQVRKFFLFWAWHEWPDAVDYYYVKTRSPVLGLPLLEFGTVFLLALAGLWLARRRLSSLLPVLVFTPAWMAATVVFFLFSRYRLPAVPPLIILASIPVAAALGRLKKNRDIFAFGLLAALAAAYVAPHLTSPKPRQDLVEYNLAVIYEKMGRDDEAAAHYRKALEANPSDFLSCLNLGNIASRRGDSKTAASWFEKAAEIEPDSDGVYTNLGSVYISLGDLDRASKFLDKALMLNPENIEALQNKSVLRAIQGRFAEAKELNRRVLEISPGWEPALNFKEKIDKIAGQ
jgi:4-amino-4-deoxy-L-arabinose transferase-like glycosyltransferase